MAQEAVYCFYLRNNGIGLTLIAELTKLHRGERLSVPMFFFCADVQRGEYTRILMTDGEVVERGWAEPAPVRTCRSHRQM